MTDPAREAVRRTAFALAERRRVASIAEDELASAIRIALRSGVPATEIAELAGISRARVYQIRDGRR